jgi:hypothetical protein|nr:MAG TPA: hypothetical protein [Caudoviricetes sp.]
MKLYVNGTEKELTMRSWDGERWGEDFFADLVEDHLMCGAEITEKQYTEEVSFWAEEVENFNAGKTTETWGNPDEFEGWEARSELGFDYD